ncbi:hypothetical protein [Tenacibaculum sp. 47A_GOM-205m]|uniref:hypothetical protein n=1 Tax=Tenacibaculum sp. 47A_GOM-205m TaxID=1380384 RepID=UPI00048FAA32|nr:hypothetical protein [Tenacibaculum sp. 47A_GOM-205m]
MNDFKKSFLGVFSLLFAVYCHSQKGSPDDINIQHPISEVASLSNFNPNMLGGSYIYKREIPTVKNAAEKGIKGSFYLFDNWNNKSIIVSRAEKTYELNNLNFDLEEGKFLSKVSKDSVYVYKDLKEVKVEDKSFINIKGDYYLELYKGNEISFFKKYSGKLNPPLMNKMTNQQLKPAEFVKKENYYIKKEDKLKGIDLNKRQVLKILTTNNKKKALSYIEENNLSLKNEGEIISLFRYIDNL